jgi:uncharacterized protein YqfA (UPF0365 family)
MDYYKIENVKADTTMRDSIGKTQSGGQGKGKSNDQTKK